MKTTDIRTWVRTIFFYIAIVAEFIVELGMTDNEVCRWIVRVVLIIIAMINWWKNNSFTAEAQAGDTIMNYLKQNKDATFVGVPADTTDK